MGTLFPASVRPNKRQRWLTFATDTKGKLIVSESARERLQSAANQNPKLLGTDVVNVRLSRASCSSAHLVYLLLVNVHTILLHFAEFMAVWCTLSNTIVFSLHVCLKVSIKDTHIGYDTGRG